MLPTLALIEIRRKRQDLMKKTAFPLAFKETGSAPDIYWKLPYQRVRNLHYQRTSNKDQTRIKQSHTELVFLFLLLLFFCLSLILSLLVLFLLCILRNTKKNIQNVCEFASF